MRSYPSYQNTRYDWLTRVPSHWQCTAMRSITRPSSKKCGDQNKALLSVYREYGVIEKSSREDNHNKESEDLSNYKIVSKNDLVMNKMKMWQGSLGISSYNGIVSPAYIVCHITKVEINHRYLHLLLRSSLFKTYYNRVSYGIRVGQWDMRYSDFKSLEVFLPPQEEQDQIVRYLDWQVSKTNKLIAALKKQITLLKEQKQATINQAVTKGLDLMMPMRDSGIAWIGEIPTHWTLIRNKNIFIEKKGTVGDCFSDYALLSLTTRGIIVRDTSESKGKFPSDFGTYKIVETGNIVFCLFDIDETPRTVGLSPLNGMITGAYDVFQIEGISSEYITYYYLSIDDKKALKPLYTGLRKVINPSTFLRIYSPLPPILEQENVVLYLNTQCDKINKLVENINNEINLLGEYRTRLISDIVTGQVDVRDVVVPAFECVSDEVNDDSDDESADAEEMVDEEA